MASVMELAGNDKLPATYKLVVEAETKTVLVAARSVAERVVKTPVDGVTAPMAVLLMVPPTIVKLLATIASVTESFGNDRAPETERLVEVSETTVIFVGLKLVAVKLVKAALVEVRLVPEAVVKVRPPVKVPPDRGK